MTTLLDIQDLRITLPVRGVDRGVDDRTVIHRVDLSVPAGAAVGLVGESGSGKSLTARAVLRLLPAGARVEGSVRVDGAEVHDLAPAALRTLRARDVAMVFQDPRAHINPVRTIGDFLTEGLIASGTRPREATATVTGLLRSVGIPDAARRLRQRPPELSGGLLQRVMIAAALATGPRLLLADEPTTALDVTTQSEVMAIIEEARAERELAMLFITHDLDLAAAVCDRIAVMYAGSVVEELPADRLHKATRHPYTRALLASRPAPDAPAGSLRAIPGRPLSAYEAPEGCAFAPRCPSVRDRCRTDTPTPVRAEDSVTACHYPSQGRGEPCEHTPPRAPADAPPPPHPLGAHTPEPGCIPPSK
ncbi:ATP-binding cassette domain-containing protein [Streptomyces sp. SID8379]|uniref:ABC transporter ATP-binding protein n=1 Tax=unclassified Streptomyces TaxID=2593676 RepID=UPI00036A0430|nr:MULTISPECIES: ABC transporter ATP-binding protein [unclassified Streptomyces]MYW67345.1 ATP-binding cassette domain-containing protein [Streptomyces sp. SID8379]